MKKNFFEINQVRKNLYKEFDEITETLPIEEPAQKRRYLKYLLFKTGQSYYLHAEFNFDDFIEKLKIFLEDEHKLQINDEQLDDVKILQISGGNKVLKFLGLSKPMTLVTSFDTTYLSFMFMSPEWFENPQIDKSNERTRFLSGLFVDNIEKFIFDYAEQITDKNLLNYASKDNYYIESFKPRYQQFFLAERDENEVLLAFLNVGNLKHLSENKDFYKKISWFFMLTNFETLLIGFAKNGDILEAFSWQNRPLVVKKGIKNTIAIDQFVWSASKNISLYKDIEEAVKLHNKQRINYIAKMNVANGKQKKKYYDYAKFLLSLTNYPSVPLITFLLDYIIDKQAAEKQYIETNQLTQILRQLLDNPQAEETLVFWFNDWKPTNQQALFVLQLLLEVAQNEEDIKKILPVHELIRKQALNKEKDALNKILIDVEYAKSLLVIGKNKQAEKILKEDLKKLPDQSIAEILPDDKTDPTGELSGQFLKVMLLSLLAKTQQKENATQFVREAAILQPLSPQRIYNLTAIDDENLSHKAAEILKIIKDGDIRPTTEITQIKYQPLDSKSLEIIKHPAYRKKGVFKSFSKWIASYEAPDHTTLKDYAERFDAEKYPKIFEIIVDLQQIFNLGTLEVYITHGENSIGIRAFEDETNFLTIGTEHLNKSSDYYLTFRELQFAIGVEIAFLYFKFAKITSSDIWRGSFEKGKMLVDTLLNIVPAVGAFSSALKSASKVKVISQFVEKNKLIDILAKTGKSLENINNTSQTVVGVASAFTEAIGVGVGGKSKKSDGKAEIIALSRMMVITADRFGLAFCNDLQSAIRAIFLTSKDLATQLPLIEKYGLNSFLLKKDENGEYINQNYAVRFANMFSFWLSDDYEKIREKLLE